jgi:hypothetical protein
MGENGFGDSMKNTKTGINSIFDAKRCRMKRKTVDIDEDLEKSIQEMAEKRNWSFSYMSYVLLQQAVKEKLRKQKVGEDNNT